MTYNIFPVETKGYALILLNTAIHRFFLKIYYFIPTIIPKKPLDNLFQDINQIKIRQVNRYD